jgi:hypothetical protein
MAPAVRQHPGARTKRRTLLIKTSVPAPAREDIDDEVRRTILRESLARYRHELMGVDERELLWDRIAKLRRQLGLA